MGRVLVINSPPAVIRLGRHTLRRAMSSACARTSAKR